MVASGRDLEQIRAARSQVEELHSPDLEDSCPERPVPDMDRQGTAAGELPAIPGYAFARLVHRGGQGVVYEAIQNSTHRRVAIKFVRSGPLADAGERSRLEREVEVLGRLNHPNIVTIHDSGLIDGHFYYVMTFVEGLPLDRWFTSPSSGPGDSRHGTRGIGDRISSIVGLFIRLCEAVNAAHLKGIIHRDLKPSNVLIDRNGEPKVLDFGLAKSISGDFPPGAVSHSSDHALTVTGQFIGSAPWASPEQAAGMPGLIDTRTDVYSLGVMLYQTVAGRFPYPVLGPLDRVLENIRAAEPAVPTRNGTPLDEDLQTIILKCLSKERERRYQTAGELARDLRHYQAREAIEARRDSAWYVLRKTLRRYRAVVMLIGGAVTVSIVFALAMALQAARLAEERDAAAREREKARRVQIFLQSMFSSIAPTQVPAADFRVRTILDHGAQRVEAEFADLPEEAAAIHETLGDTYNSLGLFPEAEHHLRRALELRRAVFGEVHPAIARSLALLGDTLHNKQQDLSEAEWVMRQALAMRRGLLGAEHEEIADSLYDLAELLIQTNRTDEAQVLAREVLDIRRRLLGDEHPSIAPALGLLGECLNDSGLHGQAEPLLREAVQMMRRVDEGDRSSFGRLLMAFAENCEARGDIDTAEALLREVIERRRRQMGEEHPALAWNLFCLGRLLLERRNDPDAAEPFVRQALQIQGTRRGADAYETAECAYLLGAVCAARGDCASAEPFYRDCLRIQREKHPGVLCSTREAHERIAVCFRALGLHQDAEELLREDNSDPE